MNELKVYSKDGSDISKALMASGICPDTWIQPDCTHWDVITKTIIDISRKHPNDSLACVGMGLGRQACWYELIRAGDTIDSRAVAAYEIEMIYLNLHCLEELAEEVIND